MYKDIYGNELDEKLRIIPYVKEVAFAFNPCNQRRFFMMKEKDMDELLKILQEAEPLMKEEAIIKLLQKEKTSPEAEAAVVGALRLISKYRDKLPKGVFGQLAKEIPEYEDLVGKLQQGCSPEEIDKLKKDLEKEIKERLEKENQAGDKELSETLKLMKDQIASMEKDLKKAQVDLQKEQDTRARIEIQNELLKDKFVGDISKAVDIVLALRKSDPKLAEAYMAQQKALGTLIGGDIEIELGKNQGGLLIKDTSFKGAAEYAKLNEKVAELQKENPGMSDAKAMKTVVQKYPDLYKAYRASLAR